MNLEQYFALHVTSADAKVAWRSYNEIRGQLDSMLEDLLEHGDQPVSADYLREAIMLMTKVHKAHVEALGALIIDK